MDHPEQLASCCVESLRVADEVGARRVAFPAVSTQPSAWTVLLSQGTGHGRGCGCR
ncbi:MULTISPECIES: macro domain-containing protein [unclassified Cryobacterium]|uniref:macro domain-containing protein n=1 Tax=unclassified Cryobacterium TaxID=2649013 RepID=UPI002B22B4D5|nr:MULTISPECIES: macro domain-containing protein [unclassified Cryobacterium]